MKKTASLLLLLVCVLPELLAQNRSISGQVLAEDTRTPLAGVIIQVIGADASTLSRQDGHYQIEVPMGAGLVFSHPGYVSRSFTPVEDINANIRLTPRGAVAIGYGTAPAHTLTGAIASLSPEQDRPVNAAAPQQLLQGRLPGVLVNTASSEPGANAQLIIRGISSVNGVAPLFVIDGMPLAESQPQARSTDLGLGTAPSRNPLNFINPADIERIDVLKDAAATAIYGVRGSGGVVLITTRQGILKKNAVTYHTTLSLSRLSNRPDLLNGAAFLEGAAALGADAANVDKGADTDWQEVVSQTALAHRHDLSYGHQHNSGYYRASLSYLQQEGIIRNSALERISGRLNIFQSLIKNRLVLGAQLTAARLNDGYAPVTSNNTSIGGLMGSTYQANPTLPADPDRSYDYNLVNPLSLLTYTQDKAATNHQLASAYLDYQMLKGLSFRFTGGTDLSNSERSLAYSPRLALLNGNHEHGRGSVQVVESQNNLLEALLRYEKHLGASSFSALAGYGYQQFSQNFQSLSAWGFSDPDLDQMVNDMQEAAAAIRGAINNPYEQFGYSQQGLFYTSMQPQPGAYTVDNPPAVSVLAMIDQGARQTDEIQSFFGRLHYGFRGKYFLSGAMRADGSTRFAARHRYGYYPAAGFAWRLSEENFMPRFFEELKLRLSYGLTGNHPLPYRVYQQQTRFSNISIDSRGYVATPGLVTYGSDNGDFRAEQTRQTNLGLDFTFFGGRLSGSFNLYRKTTENVLLNVAMAQPSTTPFSYRNTNASLLNTGQEIALNWSVLNSKNLSLLIWGNAAHNRNKVEGLEGYSMHDGGLYGQGLSGAITQQLEEGQPLNAYFLRVFQGYDEQGLAVYRIDAQETLGKSAHPRFHTGFGAQLGYRQWQLSAQCYGQFGHYLYNNTANAFFTKGSLANGRNITTEALNAAEGPMNAPDASTRFLEKGDFLRLQYLSLGYELPLQAKRLKNLRISASAENLFVLTQYSGTDPEFIGNTPGIQYTTYPRARTFSLGLSAAF